MSPTRGRHVILQAKIQRLLSQLMPEGEALPECPIETSENAKARERVCSPFLPETYS